MQRLLGFFGKSLYKMQWEANARRGNPPQVDIIHQQPNTNYLDIWPETQFVHRVKGPAYIEPLFGWIITEDGVLVDDSMAPQVRYKPPWRIGLPSPNLLHQI